MAFVYLVALDRPLGTLKHRARYYLGSCLNLNNRMKQHKAGTGAAMLRAANDRGIDYRVVKFAILPSESEARQLEIKLKSYKNHALLLQKNWSL